VAESSPLLKDVTDTYFGVIVVKTLRVGVAVPLEINIRELLGSNFDRDAGYPDSGSSRFFSVRPDKCRDSDSTDQDCFLPNPLEFNSCPTIRRYVV
jgi:hypothetical protein